MPAPVVAPVALAAEIRAEHERAQADLSSAIGHAIRCGELLAQAKEAVGHGNWLPWLEENFDASERTARTYMQMWAERQRVADLGETSIRGVLAALAKPRAQQPELPADAPPSIEETDRDIQAMADAMAELDDLDALLQRTQDATTPEDMESVLAALEDRIERAMAIRRRAAKHLADTGLYVFDKYPLMASHFLRLSGLFLDVGADAAEAEQAIDDALRDLAELRAKAQA